MGLEMSSIKWADLWHRLRLWAHLPFVAPVLLALPVVVFFFPLLKTGNLVVAGDGDYYMQLYEAMRRSLLEFHQIPWWNPWIAGGVPLLANPQFGLISIQTLFVLPFGAAIGYKLGLLAYGVVGFFGFKRLFQTVTKTDALRATLLAYVWCFGSFIGYRSGGHYTFLMVGLTPWVFYYYVTRHRKLGWLKLSLVVALMLWTAVHYITIITILLLIALFIRRFIRLAMAYAKNHKPKALLAELQLAAKFGLVTLLLSGLRLYYVFEYLNDFPRKVSGYSDPYFGIGNGLLAIFGPNQYHNLPTIDSPWSWMEASTYIGVGSGLLLVYTLVLFARKKITFSLKPALLLVPLIVFFVLGLGDFGDYSPFHLMRELPFFSSLRVAPRWFMWTSLVCLAIIAAGRFTARRLQIAHALLVAAVMELFVTGFLIMGHGYIHAPRQLRGPHPAFEQHRLWHQDRPGQPYKDENFTEATRNNVGQTIIGDPLIDTRGPVPTARCAVEQHCSFVQTNARLAYWSPNRIVLERRASGPIELQMNPGSRWRVNGTYPFIHMKVVYPSQRFIVTDPNQWITIEYVPRFSPAWFASKL
jgi:hypothetical protein